MRQLYLVNGYHDNLGITMSRKQSCIRLSFVVLMVVGLLAIPMYFIFSTGHTPIRTTDSVLFEIRPHMTASDLARELKYRKLIRSAGVFKLWLNFKGLDKKIIAGEYQILPSDTIQSFINKVTKGRMHMRKFTIVPGQRWADVEKTLTQSKLKPLTAKQKRLLKGRFPTLEGVFKPDTYFYTKDEAAFNVLLNAKKSQKKHLHAIWDARDASITLESPNDLLIIASLIEKETHFSDEYRKISSVIHNRYNIGMGLNIDASLIYSLLERGIIHHPKELSRHHFKLSSRYNTYVNRGLPVGPIAYPSTETLYAAANPVQSNWLYYKVGPSGKHVFNSNLSSHNSVNISRNLDEG